MCITRTNIPNDMKKLLFLLFMLCPMLCAAQNEWELPTSGNQPQEQKKDAKANADDSRKNVNASPLLTNVKDWEYIKEGAVPEVDGKVVFACDADFPGKSAQQIYELAYTALDSLAHSKEQIQSGIALVNRKSNIVVARYQEWLNFSSNFLALDRTKFQYTIIATCSDGHLHLTLERISYNYEENRSTGFKTTAEKWIADKVAVNKNRTKLRPGMAKFRKKTIDRQKEIFSYITGCMKRQ